MSQDRTDYILLGAGFVTGIVLPLILILCVMNICACSCTGLFKRKPDQETDPGSGSQAPLIQQQL